VLSVSGPVVRLLDSVNCRWNPEVPNGDNGHRTLVESQKFTAGKLTLEFRSYTADVRYRGLSAINGCSGSEK